MMLTDREWLRFVTFALVAGGGFGALYTGALSLRGHTLAWAIMGAVIATGLMALVVHLGVRHALDELTDAAIEPTDSETTEADS